MEAVIFTPTLTVAELAALRQEATGATERADDARRRREEVENNAQGRLREEQRQEGEYLRKTEQAERKIAELALDAAWAAESAHRMWDILPEGSLYPNRYSRQREQEYRKKAEEAVREMTEEAERMAIEMVREAARKKAVEEERTMAEDAAVAYFKRREVDGAPAPQQMARDPPPQISSPLTADAWAAKWWEVYQAEPDKAGRELYNDQMSTQPEAFYALLEPRAEGTPATVALLRGSYVLRLADKLRQCKTDEERAALRLGRRHEMGADAFLTAAQVRALRRGPGGTECKTCCATPEVQDRDRPLRLVSFTHDGHAGTKGHPDPHGQELVRFADQVRYERRCCDQNVACCPANGTCCCPHGTCGESEPEPTATRTAPVKDLSQYACCWVLEFALCQSLFCGCDSNEGYCCGLPCYGQRCGESKVAFPSASLRSSTSTPHFTTMMPPTCARLMKPPQGSLTACPPSLTSNASRRCT